MLVAPAAIGGPTRGGLPLPGSPALPCAVLPHRAY